MITSVVISCDVVFSVAATVNVAVVPSVAAIVSVTDVNKSIVVTGVFAVAFNVEAIIIEEIAVILIDLAIGCAVLLNGRLDVLVVATDHDLVLSSTKAVIGVAVVEISLVAEVVVLEAVTSAGAVMLDVFSGVGFANHVAFLVVDEVLVEDTVINDTVVTTAVFADFTLIVTDGEIVSVSVVTVIDFANVNGVVVNLFVIVGRGSVVLSSAAVFIVFFVNELVPVKCGIPEAPVVSILVNLIPVFVVVVAVVDEGFFWVSVALAVGWTIGSGVTLVVVSVVVAANLVAVSLSISVTAIVDVTAVSDVFFTCVVNVTSDLAVAFDEELLPVSVVPFVACIVDSCVIIVSIASAEDLVVVSTSTAVFTDDTADLLAEAEIPVVSSVAVSSDISLTSVFVAPVDRKLFPVSFVFVIACVVGLGVIFVSVTSAKDFFVVSSLTVAATDGVVNGLDRAEDPVVSGAAVTGGANVSSVFVFVADGELLLFSVAFFTTAAVATDGVVDELAVFTVAVVSGVVAINDIFVASVASVDGGVELELAMVAVVPVVSSAVVTCLDVVSAVTAGNAVIACSFIFFLNVRVVDELNVIDVVFAVDGELNLVLFVPIFNCVIAVSGVAALILIVVVGDVAVVSSFATVTVFVLAVVSTSTIATDDVVAGLAAAEVLDSSGVAFNSATSTSAFGGGKAVLDDFIGVGFLV